MIVMFMRLYTKLKLDKIKLLKQFPPFVYFIDGEKFQILIKMK